VQQKGCGLRLSAEEDVAWQAIEAAMKERPGIPLSASELWDA
jgi:hypothetical protein